MNSNNEVKEKGPTGMETVMGGGSCVVFIDGVAESVVVRQLAIKDFPALQKALRDEVEQVALYCGKERAWVEGLRPQDHELLILEGERINRDFFGRWLVREEERKKYLPKQDPEELAALIAVMGRQNPGLLKELMGKKDGERTESLPSGLPGSARSVG